MHLLAGILISVFSQISGWEIFSKTQFEWRYIERVGMEVEVPIFDEKIKALEGKEVTLAGYYLPFDIEGNRVIISQQPYASCFFCGGGVGLESVAEIQFDTEQRIFELDEILKVRGRLKLNTDEYGHLVFILTNSTVL